MLDCIYIPWKEVILDFQMTWLQSVCLFAVSTGRIRNKAEVDDSAADAVLSLNIISAKNIKSSHNSNRYLSATDYLLYSCTWLSRLNSSRCTFILFYCFTCINVFIHFKHSKSIKAIDLSFLFFIQFETVRQFLCPLVVICWKHSRIIAWSFPFISADFFPVNLLHCLHCLTLCASLFFCLALSFSSCCCWTLDCAQAFYW